MAVSLTDGCPLMHHIPNLICLLRIALVLPVVLALRDGLYVQLALLLALAAASDALDGWLAKHYGWESPLGRFLDAVADKLLLGAVFITAASVGLVPWWLAVAAVLRDVIIALGAAAYRLWIGPINGEPTFLSKLNTTLQFLYLLCVVFTLLLNLPPVEVRDALAWVVLLSTAASGIDYVRTYAQRAWQHWHCSERPLS
jgi:cardiolipin synthase